MANKDKRLWIDGVLGSELKDTQGETLSVDGADISELEAGKGRWNDNHGKGFFNSLGIITEAKKILKAEDCDNDRQRYYWEKIKAPYIYGKGYLYNDEDHPNARAAAAIIKNVHRDDVPLKVKASVEGGVISRGISDPTRLARTKIHSCAITFTPANNATLLEPLNLDKSSVDWESDKALIKSVMHLAETNVPSFRHIERHASANTILDNIEKIKDLAKSVGIEIDIKETTPEKIMKSAVTNKVINNVTKINELVKALNAAKPINFNTTERAQRATPVQPTKQPAMAVRPKDSAMTGHDTYQQNIGQMRNDPTVPKTPLSNVPSNRLQSASQVKNTNVVKLHASKAMKNPKHLESMAADLKSRGIPSNKIDAIVGKIKSHMAKQEEMDKGELGRAAKNLAVATAMAAGAASIGQKEQKPKPKEPTSVQREVASTKGQSKDPDLQVSPKNYDQRKPNAKIDWEKKRKELKAKMKKALTAGYGGAGAPTSLTGGGVLQSESQEKKKKNVTAKAEDSMNYITCDNCGKEQIHMKRQVKCRSCNKNFPFSKLEGLM